MYMVSAIAYTIFLSYMIVLSKEIKVNENNIASLRFTGVYQEYENSEIKDINYRDNHIDASSMSQIILKGHFDKDIEKNEQILMYIYQMKVTIKQNGQVVYTYGEEGTYPDVVKTIGIDWGCFTSKGIYTTDDIEIILKGAYPNRNKESFNIFLDGMYAGDRSSLISQMVKKHTWNILFGILTLVLGITFLLIIIVFKLMNTYLGNGYFSGGMLLICGSICTLIDYDFITLIFNNAFIVNVVDYLTQILVAEFLMIYIRTFLRNEKSYKIVTVCIYIWTMVMIVYFIIQGLGIRDVIELSTILLPIAVILILCTLVCLVMETTKNDSMQVKMILISGIILAASAFIEVINFYITHIYWICVFQIGLVIFTVIQFFIIINHVKKNMIKSKRADKMEQELIQNRISIMISQIQPHFLYNSLTAISRLCDKDPKKAKAATIEFSTYLRGNLESLKQKKPILFEKELRHVETYLSLEKMRFEDELNIVYDIQTKEFMIPSLTIQPIVENAVKHGVGKKEDGGTVTLATKETETEYLIIVSDDGIGFNVDELKNEMYLDSIFSSDELNSNLKTHVGIENVRSRLMSLCNGTLEISSEKGIGTIVTIKIPKRRGQDNEYNSSR